MKKLGRLFHRVFPGVGFADCSHITWPSVLRVSCKLLFRCRGWKRFRFSCLFANSFPGDGLCPAIRGTDVLCACLPLCHSCILWGSFPRSVIFISLFLLSFLSAILLSRRNFFSLVICLPWSMNHIRKPRLMFETFSLFSTFQNNEVVPQHPPKLTNELSFCPFLYFICIYIMHKY